jgi:hypothetical protein
MVGSGIGGILKQTLRFTGVSFQRSNSDRGIHMAKRKSIRTGIGVLARANGLVGHILEEMKNPMAYEIKQRAEEEATAHLRK